MADEEGLFDRLRQLQARTSDGVEAMRVTTARIHARVSSHDKNLRQHALDKLWNTSSGVMSTLLNILDNTKDNTTSNNVAAILRETICIKQGKGKKSTTPVADTQSQIRRVSKDQSKDNKTEKQKANLALRKANNTSRQQATQYLVSINGTQAIIRALHSAASTTAKRDISVNDALLQDLLWVLATLSQKDPKFAAKMRTLLCVRTAHTLLRNHYTNSKLIFPLLIIMKQLSKNSSTTSVLVKDGIVVTYERVLVSLGFLPTARLRLCLDAIDYFSKNRTCCAQIVRGGLARLLLRALDRWERYEGRLRLKICARVLQTLHRLCAFKSGRRLLCTRRHVQVLQRFCSRCPDEPDFDSLLSRVCAVITVCLKHQVIPVPATSPATFDLRPFLSAASSECIYPEDENAYNESRHSSLDEIGDGADDTDGELDEGEALDSERLELLDAETLDAGRGADCSSDSKQGIAWNSPNERDVEDLKRYSVFFKETSPSHHSLLPARGRSTSQGILDVGRNATSSKPVTKGAASTKGRALMLLRSHSEAGTARATSSNAAYCGLASRVLCVVAPVKVAYPDMMGGPASHAPNALNSNERTVCRKKLLSCVDRAINPESYLNLVAYDLDALCKETNKTADNNLPAFRNLTNTDEQDIQTPKNLSSSRLEFESRFESGNLRKAIQIAPREYELILTPDVNSKRGHQWFYFEVRNMQDGKPYVFNVVNCEKSDSQFNFGMKPVLFSVKEATLGRPGWIRSGFDICYYRNSYHQDHHQSKNSSRCFLTVTFSVSFPHAADVCYLAYHYPYTYSMMMTRLWAWSQHLPPRAYFRAEPLCSSLGGNEVPLLTITAEHSDENPIVDREVIFLSGRVHPGESNASWVMEGTLRALLASSQDAQDLRDRFVFKVVPMLNVEGVINGCYRCGLTNEDLNRRWNKPSPVLHPSIYHTKGLLEYLSRVRRRPPLLYCDYHGHSRKKNVFLYGCSPAESWCVADRVMQDVPQKYMMLAALMSRGSSMFSLAGCSFQVERRREGTARVCVWRQLGVTRSYTMEATFCGFDQGPYKGLHINTQHLQTVGLDFCTALLHLNDDCKVDLQMTKDMQGNIVEIQIQNADTPRSKTVDSDAGSGSDSILHSDSDEELD